MWVEHEAHGYYSLVLNMKTNEATCRLCIDVLNTVVKQNIRPLNEVNLRFTLKFIID